MQVSTHNGGFHADDVFAVATLRLALGDFDLVRTRDKAVLAASDVRVDVGGRNDPATGDFDHHQRGGAGERENGIRYASFGLVWREHGEALTGSPEAARGVDEFLVQGVDANDTGQTIMQSLVGDIRPMSVSGLVSAMNADWDEDLTPEQEDARFDEAVSFARGILERSIAGARGWQRARTLVQAAVARAEDPRVVELERNMPWRDTIVDEAPEALYVVYPRSSGGWGLQAVPEELGRFDNRRDLPEAWGGLNGEALAAVTGVADATFCHTARFMAAAESRDGILALAALALAD